MPSPSTTTPTDLAPQLIKLGLRATADSLDDLLARAIKAQWSPRVLVEEIARLESQDKALRSLQRRLKNSHVGRFRPIADFDWNWPKKIDRDLIERAFTLDFIREGRNLILVGTNGLGKSMLARNLAHQALLSGFSVLFRTAAEILDDLAVDSPLLRRRRIAKYARPHLLCCDELGYLSYDDHAADLLYAVFNPRYETSRATLVTTNLAFKDWNTVFPSATCLRTLIDRLTHHADVTLVEGDSYRARESELEAQARRRGRRAGHDAGRSK
jgi:DNA replication protein DnaC